MSVPFARQERQQLRRKYRRQWATKTGRPESEVYVPKALRDDEAEPGRVPLEGASNMFISTDPDDPNIYHEDGSICDCYDVDYDDDTDLPRRW